MKSKYLLLSFLLMLFWNSFSSEYNEVLLKANRLKSGAQYTRAIRYYNKAIKFEKNNDEAIKEIYFHIADCYFKLGREVMAYKVLTATVYKLGATKVDFENNSIVDKEFLKASWIKMEPKYNRFRQRYIASLDGIDDYLADGNYVLNPKQ
ncbi:MAG: hypothetical protein ACH34V_07860 [Flavobacterium sp.]|jgi:hypothetical protein|uniref:Tetratricopeptide repeat protein n=1 Tax=Flavobacterium celericrescens TaxID=2709780 RepID=A0ABX0IDQ9_9FLAO|nr:hypothetical protein [Flavobacterium celericrescens]NHM05361.1 hypothetical protein [Flavobacterium celericrescens]